MSAPQPLPAEVALDGVDEFLSTCVATTSAWPHNFHASEGRSWRLSLSADGARTARLPGPGSISATAADQDPDAANASAWGTADELVLILHNRIPINSLKLDGDRRSLRPAQRLGPG
ncbi:hypothetical protein ACFWOJ_39350 [Streptomyces sp. NPDC058439]|uniref:hypothetical protein n=1 Tax=Streptomyces sp. NPDC058439 TaxID=3346500 RepID=UPI00364873D8